MMTRRAILLACLLVFWAGGADAQTPAKAGNGIVNAVSFEPIPANTPITVRPLDDSDANLRLKEDFEAALRAKGFTPAPDAQIVLTFETGNEIGSWVDKGRRSLIELQAKGGRDGGEDAQAMLNIYNSTRGGLLNKGDGGTSITTPSTYTIRVTVDNRNGGKRLWEGWTTADLVQGDREQLAKSMLPVLMGNLGLTVSRKPFEIR